MSLTKIEGGVLKLDTSMLGGGEEEDASMEYEYGFVTEIDSEVFPKGLNADVVKKISELRKEPDWLLQWRLNAFKIWTKMTEPHWANITYKPINYQDVAYYSAPKIRENPHGGLDTDLIQTFEKLGVPIEEKDSFEGIQQNRIAVDAVFDSVSVATTYKAELEKNGIIFCSLTEAIKEHPDLVRKYMGTVVPAGDNFFSAMNSAVFSDGSFVYIPPHTKCPMALSSYFRINTAYSGQFERTLIVADVGSHVSYLEGCSAPMRSEHQMHAAVVEICAMEDSVVKYSTVQNWYPGDANGVGGIYNMVTKRGKAETRAKITWTQIETGSAITWKYPSCILKGDDSVGEFHSVAVTNNRQQADTGTKMIHIGNRTKSTIISKGISAGKSQQSYRGLVRIAKKAKDCRNYSQCDSLLVGDTCGAHTFPVVETMNSTAQLEHEATTSRISEDRIFYARQRGISEEEAIAMIVNGFCKEVFHQLPLEFAAEAEKLLSVSLEGSVA